MSAEVLVLHGSPGSGKTTLSRGIAELLRIADRPNAVIDLDELSMVHPYPGHAFALENLRAIWPNYAAIADLKVIIPAVVADEEELTLLRDTVAGARLVVCELTAPKAVLVERVNAREPNEFWQARLREFVELYLSRSDLDRIRDFAVTTEGRTVEEVALEIMAKAGWTF